jgi:hypothetical protein
MTERSEAKPSGMRTNGSVAWSVLMARARGGDRTAYRRLLEKIAPYLRSLAARRPSGAAEDTVVDLAGDDACRYGGT